MRWLAGGCLILGACHLAEAADPEKCPDKTHSVSGQCIADPVDGPVITIASCVLTPDSIKVAINAEFRFKNDDDVDRTVSGDDGKVWVTAKAHQQSPILGITKAGTWGYTVSDCTNRGTVVIE